MAEHALIARKSGEYPDTIDLSTVKWDDVALRLEVTGGVDISASSLYRAGSPAAGYIMTSADVNGTMQWSSASSVIPDPYTPPDGTWNVIGNIQIEYANLKFLTLAQPSACTATAVGSGGSLAAGTFYKWWVVFVTANGESELGVASNVPTTVLNDSVNLTSIPLGPTGTTARKIYRNTSAAQTEYRLVTTIANNSATTYTDGASDASLGARLWPGDTSGGRLFIDGSQVFLSTYDAQAFGALVIGSGAGPSTTGGGNVMLGPLAGATATSGQAAQTLVGSGAGRYLGAATDINNVGVGVNAIGASGATTFQTVAIGSNALANITTPESVAVGDSAGRYSGAGKHQVAIGPQALFGVAPQPALNGTYNTAIGAFAMWHYNPTTEDGVKGSANVAVGGISLEDITDGIGNIAIGFGAGLGATGEGGANSCRTSDFCGFLGYLAGQSSSGTLTNAWAIGKGAVVGASNTLVIGESASNPMKVILYDSLQIGNAASVAYNRIGTAATSHGLSALNDLLVVGNLEVDGTTFLDGTVTLASALTVANGGTGLTSGTSGGVPYFNASTTMASSAAFGSTQIVMGGGAGAAPNTSANFTRTSAVLTHKASSGNAYLVLDNSSTASETGIEFKQNATNRWYNYVPGSQTYLDWYSGSSRMQLTAVGELKLPTVGGGIFIKEGTNATMGVATLVLGTATVSTTKVSANSRIFVTVQALGTVAVAKAIAVTARTAGTSFVLTSSDLTDTSTVAWWIAEPA